ncbi:MAG: hypothetical protein GY777_05240 [Candidatus Brocadiaceae bacterium]|nr:hypothetical protein [Candidatus Brocadiaceae bacterium]
MIAKVTYPNRRRSRRINFVFEISLPDHVKGWTKNVSANGASFDIITEDIDAFSPGKVIPLDITTINTTNDSKMRTISLRGKGLIIRELIRESGTNESGRKVTITVFFMEKLNFWVPSNN